jgi:hypothetical protein
VTTLADLKAQGYTPDTSQDERDVPGLQKPQDTQVLIGFGNSEFHFTVILQGWSFKKPVFYERFSDTTMIAYYDR